MNTRLRRACPGGSTVSCAVKDTRTVEGGIVGVSAVSLVDIYCRVLASHQLINVGGHDGLAKEACIAAKRLDLGLNV